MSTSIGLEQESMGENEHPMIQLPDVGQRLWACLPEDAEIYNMGFPSKAEAHEALNGHAGEIMAYERGIPLDIAADLFDIELVLSLIEARSVASGRVLAPEDRGMFDAASEAQREDLRNALAATVVGWIEKTNLPIVKITEQEDVELATNAAENRPA